MKRTKLMMFPIYAVVNKSILSGSVLLTSIVGVSKAGLMDIHSKNSKHKPDISLIIQANTIPIILSVANFCYSAAVKKKVKQRVDVSVVHTSDTFSSDGTK